MCSWPGLSGNETTDRCCFDTQQCAEYICGYQNTSIINENGSRYCNLNATIAKRMWEMASNQTSCNGTLGCSYAKNSPEYNSSAQIEGILSGQILGIWVGVLLVLGVLNKKFH